jgi:hypothetical protein
MRITRAVVVVLLVVGSVPTYAGNDTVRTGWNGMYGRPYNGCSYLEVTGPTAAKRLILERAKKQYREADPEALAAVEGNVVVRVATVGDRGCATHVPREIIFVDKKTDTPALRLELASDVATLQNGFGAEWTSTDGVATVKVDEFQKALGGGRYKVMVVLKSGDTKEINGGGVGKITWSSDHTKKALGD